MRASRTAHRLWWRIRQRTQADSKCNEHGVDVAVATTKHQLRDVHSGIGFGIE